MNSKLIIVPYADFYPEQKRPKQLNMFLKHMTPLIKNTNINIIIAEQYTPEKYFNKGQLINAAVKWFIQKYGEPSYVISHDIDMLPDKILFELYKKAKGPISFVPINDEYREKYGKIIIGAGGGIFGTSYTIYKNANGYPNNMWLWGGEDNAFAKRLKYIGINKFSRAKYGNITHIDIQRTSNASKMDYLKKNKIRSMNVYEILEEDIKTWKNNGLNNVNSVVIDEHNKGHIYHIKLALDEIGLKEAIIHNEKIYRDLNI